MTGFTEQSLAEAFRFNALREIGAVQAAEFAERGFLVIPKLLSATLLDPLRMAFPRLFAGDFDTGVYPDEWYWREGMTDGAVRALIERNIARPALPFLGDPTVNVLSVNRQLDALSATKAR